LVFGLLRSLLCQQLLDIAHDFRDALLLLQDVGGELGGRQVRDVFLGARVLAVEVAAIGQQFGGGDFPGAFVFFALVPAQARFSSVSAGTSYRMGRPGALPQKTAGGAEVSHGRCLGYPSAIPDSAQHGISNCLNGNQKGDWFVPRYS
jgi:hypothetical protein